LDPRTPCYAPFVPPATCIRCYAVFNSEDARPGVAPVCPACASALAVAPASHPLPAPPPARRSLRPVLIGAGVVLALAAALALAVAVRRFVL
jgi:hypothetical protein